MRSLASEDVYLLNDMVVDSTGRAYVGCLGHRDLSDGVQKVEDYGDHVALVDRDGKPRVAARGDLMGPNGLAITADGRTLFVAETQARRLSVFAIGRDGSLAKRRVFATDVACDGICLDESGAVWVAMQRECCFHRILDGGRVAEFDRNRRSLCNGLCFRRP